MFIKFSEAKASYNKGQVFPFMIAIVAIMIIMAMITANLGKLAIFKTDVSNAADAAALAGASVLSGTLLGFGLTSDLECAKAVIIAARMCTIIMAGVDVLGLLSYLLPATAGAYGNFGWDIAGVAGLYVMHSILYWADYIKAGYDGEMAWANAKQTALRFAFQNVGVDEPPPVKFKNFTWDEEVNGARRHVHGSYEDYVNHFLAEEQYQSGFSKFMSHPLSGFWNNNGASLGPVKPNMNTPPGTITSGYGWTQEADETFSSSYPGNTNYKDKDNYVEVQVSGSTGYSVRPIFFAEYFTPAVPIALGLLAVAPAIAKYWAEDIYVKARLATAIVMIDSPATVAAGWAMFCELVIEVDGFGAIAGAALGAMIALLPVGFALSGGTSSQTTNNPLQVKVTRHKNNTNLGMWNFQYGDIVAKSAAHAYPESSDKTIEPVFLGAIMNMIFNLFNPASWFDTRKHLFETKLVPGYLE